jgi:hypothetical protein
MFTQRELEIIAAALDFYNQSVFEAEQRIETVFSSEEIDNVANKVVSLQEAEQDDYQEGDIDAFFGCDKEFTGDKSTEEHLQDIRGGN